jgi:dihydrofolate reductase
MNSINPLIHIIVAVAKNGVIGKDNDLVWHLPDDMKFFKEKTMGHMIVTGRKNYLSIPERFRPLSGRDNVVLSRDTSLQLPGTTVLHSLDEAIEYAQAKGLSDIMVIGGGEIYRQALPLAHRLWITEVDASPEGDTFFPEIDKSQWKELSRTHHPADERHAYAFDFVEYERI